MTMMIDRIEIDKRAALTRRECGIQTYGVKDIFSLIEQIDVQLIRYPFGHDVLLGFATFYEGNFVIASNSSEILAREIFTIAHELGHILYDFEDKISGIKIDHEISEDSEDLSEARAYYFANCFLMPEDQINNFIKLELRKQQSELNALDIVRMQLEFQVSYAALLVRLFKLKIIDARQKSALFDVRNNETSRVLFKQLDADERLLKPADVIAVPPSYLEYVISNYEQGFIPFSSLDKALKKVGMDASVFKKDETSNVEPPVDLDDIFEEYH
jgi:Zn-dependent peptidase ImmA (M78 family)